MLAWKLDLKPWDVDRMNCTDVDAFLIILRRMMDLMGGSDEIMEMTGW